jgi:hypothetical protein
MKLIWAIIILVISGCLPFMNPNDQSVIAYYEIKAIKQPSSMSCWATVYTMMLSWKNNTTLTLDSAVDRLGNPWKTYFYNDDGLPLGQERLFVSTAGLREEPPANYSIQGFINMLKNYGPLWIVTGNGISSHARLLIGINGDGSYENSKFSFINPQTGKIETQDALDFFREFELEARFVIDRRLDDIPFRWQIIHW